jgi:hypothetical protein
VLLFTYDVYKECQMSAETPYQDVGEDNQAVQEHDEPATFMDRTAQTADELYSSAFFSRLVGGLSLASGLVSGLTAMTNESASMSTPFFATAAGIALAVSGYNFHGSSADSCTGDVYLAATLAAEAQNQQPPLQTEFQPALGAWTGTDVQQAP